ncbi:MAG TPA: hypothetical protein VN132_00320, partial [Bdellovibrio sp.]|nr:hypothetical protein [Bdellovibrio sp.]
MKRTHQYLLVGSFVAVALSLSACDEGSSSRRPVRVAQHAKNGNGRNADPKAGTKGTGTQSTTSSTVCATDATTGKRAGTTPADQCFNALCTEKTNLSKIASDGEKGTTEQQDYYKKSLLPLLTTKIQARQKNLQARLDHYNAEEKNFDSAKTTLNDFQLKAIKGVLLTRNDSHISADISKSAIEALQASDFAKAYATFTTNKGNSYLQAMQKGVSIEEAIAAEVSYMTATKDKLNKALNAEIIGQNRLLEKAAKKTPLSNSEIEALSRDSHNIHMLDFFVFGAGADLLSKATVANSDLLTYETNFKNKLQTKVKTQNTDMTDCEKQAYRLMNLSPQKT